MSEIKLEIDNQKVSLIQGGEQNLKVTKISEGVEKNVTWQSNKTNIVNILTSSADGATIKAVGIGEAVISATLKHADKEYTAKCNVTVTPPILLDKSELFLKLGDADVTITATAQKNVSVTWTVEDPNIAVVSTGTTANNSSNKPKALTSVTTKIDGTANTATCNITPNGLGMTIVTAKIDGTNYTASCKVTVDNIISLDSSAFSLYISEKQKIKATCPVGVSEVDWEIKDKNIANFLTSSEEEATVPVADIPESSEEEATVPVVDIPESSEEEATVPVADIPESSEEEATVPVADILKSSAKEVTIKAVGIGKTVITATITYGDKEYSATCVVKVNSPRLNRNRLTLLKENDFQLEMIPSDLPVTWSSSDKSVATVDGKGMVKACSKGTTKVIATTDKINGNEYSAECSVTVEDKMLDVFANLANERFDQYKDGEEKYKFSFTPKSKKDVILVQGEEKQCKFDGDEDNTMHSFVLTEVSFHKEIYQPGYVEVVIKTDSPLSLFEGWTSLEYIPKEGESPYVIAKNYYIFEKKKKRGYVTLKAYSADRFLTLDKFCQVYTGKTLVAGMIATTFQNYGDTANFKEYCSALGCSLYVENLQHLKLTARIPYAVQYNESFYDFLVRMCNRHGEFLYCEGNQLHVGLQESEDVTEIEETDDVEIEYSESGWTYANEVKTMYSDCLTKNGVGGVCGVNNDILRPQGQMFVDDSIYPEHYFEKYQKSGEGYKYATADDFSTALEKFFIFLQTFAECQTLADALMQSGVKMSMLAAITETAKEKINDKYNEVYFDEEKVGDETKSYYPFSSPTDGLTGNFYDTILQKEKEAEKNKVTVVCSTCQKYQLGDRVNIDGKEYVVYRVKGSAKVLGGVLDGTRRYVDSYELLLLPIDGEKYYPLPMMERRILKASPQRAIVKNPLDPQKLGRVQVAYPWQSVNDTNFSPWLRVAYPMATGEGGFMFFPEIGDEVLVDYEGGNIERPFVAGSFYSEDRKPAAPAQMHLMGTTKSITSPNGHHISFTDPKDNAKFLANFIPIWSLLSKFGTGVSFDTEFWNTHGKHLVGGFEISDYFGVYSIKGNTENRSISIESPLGDITLDAFTGITINAPHGDVKIVGKNVDIEARNNLTITSGTNIKNSFLGSRRHGGIAANVIKQLAGLLAVFEGSVIKTLGFDLSFYRICLEVVLRPIGGTMLVKSHRFMHIEAGDGVVPLQSVRKESKGGGDNIKAAFHGLFRHSFSNEQSEDTLETKFRSLYELINKAFPLFLEVEVGRTNVLAKRQELVGLNFNNVNLWEELVKVSSKEIDENHLKNHFGKTFPQNQSNDPKDKYVALGKELAALRKIYVEIANLPTTSPGEITTLKNVFGTDWDNFKAHFENHQSDLNYVSSDEIKKDNLKKQWKRCLYNAVSGLLKHDLKFPTLNTDEEPTIAHLNGISYDEASVPTPGVRKVFGNAALMGLIKSTGTEGGKDDNMWSIKDKGGIYFSAKKGHAFHLATDGSLQGDRRIDLYTLVYDYLKRIIDR